MCNVFFYVKQDTAYDILISDWSSDVCSSDLAPEARVVLDPPDVAFEVPVIYLVEADQGCEQPDIRLCELVAGDVALARKLRVEPVERLEHPRHGLVIGGLAGGEARLVDPIVDTVVDALVESIDKIGRASCRERMCKYV